MTCVNLIRNVPAKVAHLNWKTKAAIQRAFARLPVGGETLYYQMQRRFGNLRQPESPLPMIQHAAQIFAELRDAGTPVEGARVLEIGTGHRLNMPIAFFLAGAASVTSLDLYPILKPELALMAAREVCNASERVVAFFGQLDPHAVKERLDRLAQAKSFSELCRTIHLDYRAPCDATGTGLASHSVDIHYSYTVFEHIPRTVLVGILREASRLIAEGGRICHHIDLSDHYSHADPRIGKINFLRFSTTEWRRIENARFGYQNRLRVTNYREIYAEAGQAVERWFEIVDSEALATLRNGFPLAAEFADIAPEILATVSIRAISQPTRERVHPV